MNYNKNGELSIHIIDFGKARLSKLPLGFEIKENMLLNETNLVSDLYDSLLFNGKNKEDIDHEENYSYLSYLGATTAKVYTDKRISPETEWIYGVS